MADLLRATDSNLTSNMASQMSDDLDRDVFKTVMSETIDQV